MEKNNEGAGNVKLGYGTIINDCEIGEGTVIWNMCNLYRCRIGKGCKIASFVEIGEGVLIGNNCKIEAFAFIPKGVIIGDSVFVGPHVTFCNDKYPTVSDDWTVLNVVVKDGASIGANSTILPKVTIGKHAIVGAGSVVCDDVPDNGMVYGYKAENRNEIP